MASLLLVLLVLQLLVPMPPPPLPPSPPPPFSQQLLLLPLLLQLNPQPGLSLVCSPPVFPSIQSRRSHRSLPGREGRKEVREEGVNECKWGRALVCRKSSPFSLYSIYTQASQPVGDERN